MPNIVSKLLGAVSPAEPDGIPTDGDLLLRGLKNAGIDLEALAEQEKQREITNARRRERYARQAAYKAEWDKQVTDQTSKHLQAGILTVYIDDKKITSMDKMTCPHCGVVSANATGYAETYTEAGMRYKPWHEAPIHRGGIGVIDHRVLCPCGQSFHLVISRVWAPE